MEDAERNYYDACQPLSRLYTVRVDDDGNDDDDDDESSRITPITSGDISHDDPDFAGASVDPEIFVERLRARRLAPYHRGFAGLMTSITTTTTTMTTTKDDGRFDDDEDDGRRALREGRRQRRAAVDVEACDGTLLLFDSVCVPHEVLPMKAGMRLALGGWYHEPSRSYPSCYDAAFSAISALYGERGGGVISHVHR